MQNDNAIEVYTNQRTEDGKASFEVVFPQDGTGSAEVIVAITSMTDNSGTADMDETVSFNVQVVPEFATLAVMVTGFSIAIVLAINRFKNQSRDVMGVKQYMHTTSNYCMEPVLRLPP